LTVVFGGILEHIMNDTANEQYGSLIDIKELGNTDQALTEFILRDDRSIDGEIDEQAAAQVTKSTEILSIPLVITLIQDERRTSYRRGDVACSIANGTRPKDGTWIEVDLRVGLDKALEKYGSDLLAYEKVYAVTTLNLAGIEVRKKQVQTIRVLVRKPTAVI
jgi:hypothetical protein